MFQFEYRNYWRNLRSLINRRRAQLWIGWGTSERGRARLAVVHAVAVKHLEEPPWLGVDLGADLGAERGSHVHFGHATDPRRQRRPAARDAGRCRDAPRWAAG